MRKVLKNVGLTEKEADVYIFLAKHGALKGNEIAKQTRIDKAEVYRILKSLQGKDIVETTLEAPTRFVTVPFDKVIDSFVKARRDEAALIERKKKELLDDWKKISKTSLKLEAEKFVVIEGTSKIYSKILQMTKETKSQLLTVTTVESLTRAVQFGLFDVMVEHPLKSSIRFSFLTELTKKNVSQLKNLLREIPAAELVIKGRTPDLGLKLSPRMVVKDSEEALFFTNPAAENALEMDPEVCLWTNCKAIVQALTRVFEDLWAKSTDIYRKMAEVELGGALSPVHYVFNPGRVKKKYGEMLATAKEEICALTSSDGLRELWKNNEYLKTLAQRNVSIKIMAPIIKENLTCSKQLSEFCAVRHVSQSSFTTMVFDNRHLFQFRHPPYPKKTPEMEQASEDFVYTDEFERVHKAKSILDSTWENSQVLSDSEDGPLNNHVAEIRPFSDMLQTNELRPSVLRVEEHTLGNLTEKDVIDKIVNARRLVARNPLTDMNVQYGSSARAVIHPPPYFNLPETKIEACHWNKQSSWGAEDWITIYLWLETRKGRSYVPVAHVTDNLRTVDFRRGVYAGTPAGQNVILARKDRIQVRVQGNTLFAGWTMTIPLYPPQYSLPPCCILFEGHGNLTTGRSETSLPSGKTQVHEFNGFAAFATFFHPSSKYSAPGTDGSFNREHIMTAYPPHSSQHRTQT